MSKTSLRWRTRSPMQSRRGYVSLGDFSLSDRERQLGATNLGCESRFQLDTLGVQQCNPKFRFRRSSPLPYSVMYWRQGAADREEPRVELGKYLKNGLIGAFVLILVGPRLIPGADPHGPVHFGATSLVAGVRPAVSADETTKGRYMTWCSRGRSTSAFISRRRSSIAK